METEPENSSLPAEDTSAMKYVIPLFSFHVVSFNTEQLSFIS